ncbi:MAG: hypothetical protein WCV67_08370 [Victivallaceae bacterium]|jgi:hypothetical protein
MNEFHIRLQKQNIPEEELLADLKRVASEFSQKTLPHVEYDAKVNFGVTTFLRRFKQWNLALKKAGLEAPNRQNIPDAELFENIAAVWTSIGRQPLGRELDKTQNVSKFSLGTYEHRFGSWNKTLLAFETFIISGKVNSIQFSQTERPREKSTGV